MRSEGKFEQCLRSISIREGPLTIGPCGIAKYTPPTKEEPNIEPPLDSEGNIRRKFTSNLFPSMHRIFDVPFE